MTWRRIVEEERRQAAWNDWNITKGVASNRAQWKQNDKTLCAYWRYAAGQ